MARLELDSSTMPHYWDNRIFTENGLNTYRFHLFVSRLR